jgi:hypothetical protein
MQHHDFAPHTGITLNMFTAIRFTFKEAVSDAAGPTAAAQIQWTKSAVPTISNIETVVDAMPRPRPDAWRTCHLHNSVRSPLDNLHGNFEATLASLAYRVQPGVAAKSKAFAEVLGPLGTAQATRLKAWRNWKTVITWAIANNALDNILPMDQPTFQALLWELTALGATHSTLKGVIDAVAGRHREARLPSPLSGNLSYQRLNKSLARVIGKPHLRKFGITRDMVVQLLSYRTSSPIVLRNNLLCCTMTMGIMRPAEASLSQSCDYEFQADFNKGLTQFEGCGSLRTLQRKNDQIRAGHEMRFGKSADPALDINHQLRLFMNLVGTNPKPGCTKQRRPGARCPVCPPLFPKLQLADDGSYSIADDPVPSAALISTMVVSALKNIGIHGPAFSGVSCRMGGLTIATEACVTEACKSCGCSPGTPSSERPATTFDRLYDTWRAFKL